VFVAIIRLSGYYGLSGHQGLIVDTNWIRETDLCPFQGQFPQEAFSMIRADLINGLIRWGKRRKEKEGTRRQTERQDEKRSGGQQSLRTY
jgi:hypothetical protein